MNDENISLCPLLFDDFSVLSMIFTMHFSVKCISISIYTLMPICRAIQNVMASVTPDPSYQLPLIHVHYVTVDSLKMPVGQTH